MNNITKIREKLAELNMLIAIETIGPEDSIKINVTELQEVLQSFVNHLEQNDGSVDIASELVDVCFEIDYENRIRIGEAFCNPVDFINDYPIDRFAAQAFKELKNRDK